MAAGKTSEAVHRCLSLNVPSMSLISLRAVVSYSLSETPSRKMMIRDGGDLTCFANSKMAVCARCELSQQEEEILLTDIMGLISATHSVRGSWTAEYAV